MLDKKMYIVFSCYIVYLACSSFMFMIFKCPECQLKMLYK